MTSSAEVTISKAAHTLSTFSWKIEVNIL